MIQKYYCNEELLEENIYTELSKTKVDNYLWSSFIYIHNNTVSQFPGKRLSFMYATSICKSLKSKPLDFIPTSSIFIHTDVCYYNI